MTTYFCDRPREVTTLNGAAQIELDRLEPVESGQKPEMRTVGEFSMMRRCQVWSLPSPSSTGCVTSSSVRAYCSRPRMSPHRCRCAAARRALPESHADVF